LITNGLYQVTVQPLTGRALVQDRSGT